MQKVDCMNSEPRHFSICDSNSVKVTASRVSFADSDNCDLISENCDKTISECSDVPSDSAEELQRLKHQIEVQDQKLKALSVFQSDASKEIEELTSSLFTEAYKMVDDAKMATVMKEQECKKLKMEIEALKRENLRMRNKSDKTRSPSMNDSEIGDSKEIKSIFSLLKRSMKKKPLVPSLNSHNSHQMILLVDPLLYNEFQSWVSNKRFDTESPFYKRIMNDDILPSIRFPDREITERVLNSMINENLKLEKLPPDVVDPEAHCSILPDITGVEFRLSFGDSDVVLNVSPFVRNKIVSVSDIYYFICNVIKGPADDFIHVYKQLITKRKAVYLARLGFPA